MKPFWKKKKKEAAFESLQDLMNTAKFKELVEETIQARRTKNAETMNGADETIRLKESPFLKFERSGMTEPEALSAEFLRIDLGTSELPASQRNFIRSVVEPAIVGTLEFYQS